ncbi:MAG: repair protein RecO protein [candidate division CPR1 bacterium GW2011_GWA2_42_17]|uniref:DNA repair protein RecO n=1 Tax=candidate division CPR1 bacterium GW2011_GWA2_42_17 TaxID=1618341 RepID=A0A0G1BBK6_9BACT|nr:MAG: repair protein RecO protein [candidate division CPR1 bacterium GW2011_GWA2_42_17]
MTYSDQGIIVRRADFREAERLVVLFSKDHGKLVLRAPGAKKPTSRKTYHLETFNYVQFLAARGKNFDIITETKTLNNFAALRTNLRSLSLAFYACELVDRLTREEEENRMVFDLFLEFLMKLNAKTSLDLDGQIRNFETRLLDICGFWPHNGFKKFDQRDFTEWGRFNKSLIEWILEGSLKSEGFLNSVRPRLALQGEAF